MGRETHRKRPGGADEEKPRRYHGTVTLNSERVGRDAGRIADEVLAHLYRPCGLLSHRNFRD
jgi:Arc/MetJ family transcription regulator